MRLLHAVRSVSAATAASVVGPTGAGHRRPARGATAPGSRARAASVGAAPGPSPARRPGRPRARIATYSAVHGPTPGSASKRARASRPVAAGVELQPAVGDLDGQRCAARGPGPPVSPRPRPARSASASSVAPSGTRASATAVRLVRAALPERRRRAGRPACGRRPPTPAGRRPRARRARSRRRRPGTRSPGRAATSGASAGSAASTASTTVGSASRSSSRRTDATTAPRSDRSGSRSRGGDVSGAGLRARRPRDRAGCRPRGGAGGRSASSTPGTARAARKPRISAARVRLAVHEPEHQPAGPGVGRRARPCVRRRAAQLGRRGSRTRPRITSLNWRTLAKPAANAMSVIGSAVWSTSSRAVCARRVRASASGPTPDLGHQASGAGAAR